MRCPFLNAVVGRIANFPFWVRCGVRGCGVGKRAGGWSKSVQYNMGLCCMDRAGDGGGANSRRGVGR